jgi:hypothetical protein
MLSLLALHRKAYPHKDIFTLKERVKTQTNMPNIRQNNKKFQFRSKVNMSA